MIDAGWSGRALARAEPRAVERARIVLAAAEVAGGEDRGEVGCSEQTVKKWRHRSRRTVYGLRIAGGRPLVPARRCGRA